MRAPFLLLLALALSGCLGDPPSDVRASAYLPTADAQPGRTATFAIFLENTSPFRLDAGVGFENVPSGWNVTAETATVVLPGESPATLLVNVTPSSDAAYGLHELVVRVGGAPATLHVRVTDGDAREARPGIGVRVRTVGFYDNGSVFYHNWREVRDNGAIPKRELRGADEEPSFDELRVYVGGRRGEAPPEPYNTTGYVPVIEGFDHALRGMRAGETRATRIEPELAYTRPGGEEHPLYGLALNFVILVTSLDELPPPSEGPIPGCPPPLCGRAGRNGHVPDGA